MLTEIWKDIPECSGFYQASNAGRIKSIRKTIIRKNGIPDNRKEKMLTPANNGSGYKFVCLCVNGIQKRLYVHRIIAKTFLPSLEGHNEVNHINGNKSDNSIENLEWSTRSKNNKHAYDNGLKVPYERTGTKNPNYKHGNRCRALKMEVQTTNYQ